MALILSIETATKTCSVSIAKDGIPVAFDDFTSQKYSHSERLNGMIESVVSRAGIKLGDLDAISVSEGPGSYTGLRIGTSTAKGLCYALDIPLIAVNSLRALAGQKVVGKGLLCPLFDARRMEVYAAIFSPNLMVIMPTEAVVIDETSFEKYLAEESVCFFGPGAEKCQELITHPNAHFDLETTVSARGMAQLAEQKFQENDTVDLAYFEPFYLKDFIAGAPKKLL